MTEGELLHRLDRTLERNSEALDRSSRALERNSDAFDLMVRAFERFIESDNRLMRGQARLERAVDDLRDQIAANTQALLRLIDRLGPAPG